MQLQDSGFSNHDAKKGDSSAFFSDIENLVDKEDEDRYDRENEIEQMGNEDIRRQALESHDIFDMDPNFELSVLFNEN